jgi:hypothetical protein
MASRLVTAARLLPRPLADEGGQGQDVFGLGERSAAQCLPGVGENRTLVRRPASGQRVLHWILGIGFVGIGFVVGLAAHIGGFLLKTSATVAGYSDSVNNPGISHTLIASQQGPRSGA